MSYRPICDVWLLARGAGSSGKPAYYGAFPSGFLRRAKDFLLAGAEGRICHLCSGAVQDPNSTTVDIDPSVQPDYVGDATSTPFMDNSFDAVLIDPPYTEEDARHYGDCPLPPLPALLKEACRIVKPGGKVGLLHLLVPRIPVGYVPRYVALIAIITGSSQRIRVFTVLRKVGGWA